MFLEITGRRNPGLIDTAVEFHQQGTIPANCYLIDQDAVAFNAALIQQAAGRHGISLYFITKQIGFNPRLARAIVQAGIEKAVAVDPYEAYALARSGIPLGHVGHIVQIPRHTIPAILQMQPEVITTYSVGNAGHISAEMERLDARQEVSLLLRVNDHDDFIYPGQACGIFLADLVQAAEAIGQLPHVRIVGVTSFPCLLFDDSSGRLKPTPNLATILKAAELLQSALGIAVEQINAPSNTCAGSIPLLAGLGATHGEPGHALTGTTPLHAHTDQPELPAMVYVSEVSHCQGSRAIAIGGGVYRRARIDDALVGSGRGKLLKAAVLPLDPAAIDYYVTLELPAGASVRSGDTVLWASRTQAFVTRALVAVVSGIQSGRPELVGLFDPWGNEMPASSSQNASPLQDGSSR